VDERNFNSAMSYCLFLKRKFQKTVIEWFGWSKILCR